MKIYQGKWNRVENAIQPGPKLFAPYFSLIACQIAEHFSLFDIVLMVTQNQSSPSR